jgi:uncharacterized membrane protein
LLTRKIDILTTNSTKMGDHRSRYTTVISLSCLVGVLLSAYALLVEVKAEHDSKYEALCDISEHVSCTKVFMSEYGRGFGVIGWMLGEDSPLNVPNSVFGIIFYTIIGVLGNYFDNSKDHILIFSFFRIH